MSTTPTKTNERTIRDDENLANDDFMKRLRISYPTYLAMVDAGLPVRTFGRYRRISGREFNSWMESQPLLKERIAGENATA